MIYPNHGAGSPCGADIGERLSSTIGYERKFNKFLQFPDVKSFTDYAIKTAPPVPHYYPVMKKLNAKGPEILGNLPRVPGLPPKAFKEAIKKKAGALVDTRTMLAFGGGHIPGALNIGGSPVLSIWAGWMLASNEPILLVLENESDLEEIVRLFIRTGYSKFAGYLVGGMKAWDAAGFPNEEIGQMTIHELNKRKAKLQIVDVRSPREWKNGHVPGARHIFLPELRKRVGELDRKKANGGLLREWLPRQHRGEHFERRRFRQTLECAGQLGSVEESEVSGGRSERPMNGSTTAALPRRSFGETMRADVWWTQPLLVFLGLSTFIVYSTWAAFQGTHYYFGNYVSPFYSPEIFGNSPHSWFGPKPSWWPGWLLFSPALLILWAPGGFRLTCYYYRGAYYKAFWADPPACTVGEPRKTYLGERSFPLIMQNVHRYFLYLALIFIVILTYDVWKAMWFASGFGIGIGTIVLAINVVLLGGYTFGCHSLRHLIGGFRDQLARSTSSYRAYACVSCLNRRHMMWAWMSLFWVGFTDLYVRLCSMGVWHDVRIF